MPIVTFHLVEGLYPPEALRELLVRGSQLYARALDSPTERVLAFVRMYPAQLAAVAGEPVSERSRKAPYFEFLAPRGGPADQRHELLRGLTDLLAELLDAPRELIVGVAVRVDPEDWAIAGEPASARRAAQIAARARAGIQT
jgi:phenylpyruvate tautomerase PptA (4-oxalocrotonate tautomerase family)